MRRAYSPRMEVFESSNHRPGEPHRLWDADTVVIDVDFALVVGTSGAVSALRKIGRGEALDAAELQTVLTANSWADQIWYRPVAVAFEGRLHLSEGVDALLLRHED